MDSNLLKSTGSASKKVTQQVVRMVKDESLEMFKSARKQIAGEFFDPASREQPKQDGQPQITEQQKQAKVLQSTRRLEQLEAEIQKIRQEAQAKKNAQLQNEQQLNRSQAQQEQADPLAEPTTKRKRGMFGATGNKVKAGMKNQLDKLNRKSEIRMPPSG